MNFIVRRAQRFVPNLFSPKLRPLIMEGGPLVFVHVPKTAGTTFSTDFLLPLFTYREAYQISLNPKRRYAGTWQKLESSSEEFRRPFRLVSGHMPFGLADGILPDPRYMTFLRDPVERALSDYFYCRQSPNNPAHGPAMELDILEFCRRGFGQMQNCHARYLSNEVFGTKYDSQDEMLAAAKANLDRCFFFGLTERFGDSLEILYRKVGYRGGVKKVPVRNPSKRPDSISDEIRAELAGFNALDIDLYNYASERFENQVPQLNAR